MYIQSEMVGRFVGLLNQYGRGPGLDPIATALQSAAGQSARDFIHQKDYLVRINVPATAGNEAIGQVVTDQNWVFVADNILATWEGGPLNVAPEIAIRDITHDQQFSGGPVQEQGRRDFVPGNFYGPGRQAVQLGAQSYRVTTEPRPFFWYVGDRGVLEIRARSQGVAQTLYVIISGIQFDFKNWVE
jgi:hypothetical protein